MIYNNTGTAQTGAILPLAVESHTVIFGPVTGATAFRNKVNPYLFHVRASYADEARRIVSQLQETGTSRIVVVYQDDGLGKSLLGELQDDEPDLAPPAQLASTPAAAAPTIADIRQTAVSVVETLRQRTVRRG